ncbi:MAG: hypothetical protein KDA91_15655 [Planctomycetaceae bacterium]|nr:hypothetical protein [Planctomycetaceae bacterium]
MQFSVVGDQPSVVPLIQLIHDSAVHGLNHCYASGQLANELATAGIPIQVQSTPEDAFLASGVDVVVIAMDDCERILNLTRSAVQADRHVVVFIPESATTAFSFELHLILDESTHSIVPLTGRMQLKELGSETHQLFQTPEPWLQIAIDTHIRMNDALALRQRQIQMLDIPAALGLLYTQITAIESRSPDGQLISRLLTLGNSAMAEQNLPPATITIHGPASPSSMQNSGTVICLNEAGGRATRIELSNWEGILARIAWLCGDKGRCVPWMEAFSTAMELNDAVDKSLRRRRTVDVYFDSGSERGVFKSQMTAIGCGVLTWTLFGMVAFLVIAKAADWPPLVLQVARALWVAPVVLFLVAQFLLPVTRDRSSHKSADSSGG